MFLDDSGHRLHGPAKALVEQAVGLLRKVYASVYATDNLVVIGRHRSFLHDPDFQRALAVSGDNPHTHRLAWRIHTLSWAARNAVRVGGDFVECGVFRANKSTIVMADIRFDSLDRHFYLYDTFAGVPEKFWGPDTLSSPGHRVPGIYEEVVARFAHQPRVHVVRGIVPDALHEEAPEKVGYLHLDMNSAEAEQGALEFFWPRMVPGGTVVLDDYGWEAFRPQQEMADAFFGPLGYTVLTLPTGQGVVVKRPG
jgi:O-methyltransferase